MKIYDKFYIGGQWVSPVSSTKTVDVIHSGTEEPMGRVPMGDEADIDAAVAAVARIARGG